MSKTKRGHSILNNPGPGSYNADFQHQFATNGPETFGSTEIRNSYLNRNVMNCPFVESSYMKSPPVGHYSKSLAARKSNRIHGAMINQNQLPVPPPNGAINTITDGEKDYSRNAVNQYLNEENTESVEALKKGGFNTS